MNFGGSSRFTRSATKAGLLAALVLIGHAAAAAPFEEIIRKAVRANGFIPAEETHVPVIRELANQGQIFFESKLVSLNGNISCRNCHLDEFGSADGIPNAIAVGGEGKGAARVLSGGFVPFFGYRSQHASVSLRLEAATAIVRSYAAHCR